MTGSSSLIDDFFSDEVVKKGATVTFCDMTLGPPISTAIAATTNTAGTAAVWKREGWPDHWYHRKDVFQQCLRAHAFHLSNLRPLDARLRPLWVSPASASALSLFECGLKAGQESDPILLLINFPRDRNRPMTSAPLAAQYHNKMRQ